MAQAETKKPPATDLGWMNGWKETPLAVQECERLKHQPRSVDVGPPNRGLETVVTCEICNIVYRIDSSD